jgi:hypothetical protein
MQHALSLTNLHALFLFSLTQTVRAGNRDTGGLVHTQTGCAIFGFVRFIQGYYLVLVTQSRKLGAIGGNTVYGIKATEMIAISSLQEGEDDGRSEAGGAGGDDEGFGAMVGGFFDKIQRRLNPTAKEIAEQKYFSIFQFIELTKDFYYSMSYDLTHTLQHNMTAVMKPESGEAAPAAPTQGVGEKPDDAPDDAPGGAGAKASGEGARHNPFGRRTDVAWNHYLTAEFESIVGADDWVVPMLNGHFVQRRCSIFGCHLDIILLGRRSRYYAGTRYLKRGISDQGKVANDVESEQILHVEGIGGRDGCYASYVQMRGSIPVYWSQETSVTQPKPPITLKRKDPTFAASRLHVQDCFTRYGSPLLFLNLVKQKEKREREVLVGREFALAVRYLNNSLGALPPRGAPQHSLRYVALDFSRISKEKHMDVMKALDDIATWTLDSTGFFCTLPPSSSTAPKSSGGGDEGGSDEEDDSDSDEDSEEGEEGRDEGGRSEAENGFIGEQEHVEQEYMEQHGVIRSNCVDCLDRTNVAQFSVAMCALGRQLFQMGLRNTPVLDIRSRIVVLMMEMWSQLGDRLAIQYGGSEAHKKVDKGGGANSKTRNLNKHKELLTSIRRYYSNSFTDRLKQDAINLFLGNFVPSERTSDGRGDGCGGGAHLWDLDNDQYLHNFNVTTGPVKLKEQLDWERKEEEKEVEEQQERQKEAIESGRAEDEALAQTPASKAARRRLRCAAYLERDKWWKQPIFAHHAHKFDPSLAAIAAIAASEGESAAQAAAEASGANAHEPEHGRYPTFAPSAQDSADGTSSPEAKLMLPSPFELRYAPQQLTEFDEILACEFLQPISIEDKPQDAGGGGSVSGGVSSGLTGAVSTAVNIPAALGAGFGVGQSGSLSSEVAIDSSPPNPSRLSMQSSAGELDAPPVLTANNITASSVSVAGSRLSTGQSRLSADDSFSSGVDDGNYEAFNMGASNGMSVSPSEQRMYEGSRLDGSRLSRHGSSASTEMGHTMNGSDRVSKAWSIKKFVGGAKNAFAATIKSTVPSTIQDGIDEGIEENMGEESAMDAMRMRGLTGRLGDEMLGMGYGGTGAYDSAAMITLDHFSHYVSFEHEPERCARSVRV